MRGRMGTLVRSTAEPMLITTYAAFQISPCDVMLMICQLVTKPLIMVFFPNT